MSQQDKLYSREYITPGMPYRHMFDCCASESGLRKMSDARLAIAMRVDKQAGRGKKRV